MATFFGFTTGVLLGALGGVALCAWVVQDEKYIEEQYVKMKAVRDMKSND